MISMKINHFSNVLSMNMDCRVLLPDEAAASDEAAAAGTERTTYKVLWLCHGGSGDENEWLYYSTVSALADEKKIAVVIVNANDSCFVDMPHGLNYGTYIGKELPEILWQMFPCLSDRREDNYISGLSNGGYGCFIIGLLNRDTFGAIGAFSAGDKADAVPKPYKPGTMNPRVRMFGQEDIQNTDYSIKYLAGKTAALSGNKPYIYHACGSLDPWLDLNIKVKECFEELKCPEYHYVYHQMEGMAHEWKFWDVEIRNFLEYIDGIEK